MGVLAFNTNVLNCLANYYVTFYIAIGVAMWVLMVLCPDNADADPPVETPGTSRDHRGHAGHARGRGRARVTVRFEIDPDREMRIDITTKA